MKLKKTTIAFISALIIAATVIAPANGWAITVQEEEDLSREYLKIIFKHSEIIDDSIVVNYVNGIGNKIVATLPPQPFTFHFYVIKKQEYNAFASPAGHIFLFSGLFEALDNESELAGIIAHEIAHVVCRHISQQIERSKKIGVATLAGIAAGILLGAGGAGEAANAVAVGSVAAGQSMALKYSREDENQADQIGLESMTKAGYNGKAFISVLNKLRSKQWFGENEIPAYIMTHPTSKERMAFIDTWLEQHSPPPDKVDPYAFNRVHTWLIAEKGDADTAINTFAAAVEENPSDALEHYGYGLALARKGHLKDAIDQLKQALATRAFDPYILKDLGRLYFLDGKYAEALKVLQGTASISKDDPDLLFYLGRTQMEMERFTDAATTFEKLISLKPDAEQAFYHLGQTYGKLGKLGDAHYNLGIYYNKKENFEAARFHLHKALAYTNDQDKKAAIEDMLKKMQKK